MSGFVCPGCGKQSAYLIVSVYSGLTLVYSLCRKCGHATGRKAALVMERVARSLGKKETA